MEHKAQMPQTATGARFLAIAAMREKLRTLRLAHRFGGTVRLRARAAEALSIPGSPSKREAARSAGQPSRARRASPREKSVAAQKTERGNRAHFGRATRTARAPVAGQLENYLPQSN